MSTQTQQAGNGAASDNTYTTSRGVTIEFLSIPRAIQKFHLKHQQPEPPKYAAHSKMTGATEYFPHDATTLRTDEDKAAWKEYQEKLYEYNEKFLRICFIKGIIVRGSMDEWLAEQAALEIPVAEDATARKLEWIYDRIVVTLEDFEQVTLGVMRASNAPEEVMTQIESLFRGAVEQPAGAVLERAGQPVGGDDGASVVLQPEIRGSADSVRDADPAIPVRQVETN